MLLDVVRALGRRVKVVSREYADGHTVFIDRHLPKSFRWLTKTVRVDPFLLVHEIVEKALLDELRLHYLHAHQIAVRAERDAVKAADQRFMKRYERSIEPEKIARVPRNLHLTPFRDQNDFALLRRFVRKEKRSSRHVTRRRNRT